MPDQEFDKQHTSEKLELIGLSLDGLVHLDITCSVASAHPSPFYIGNSSADIRRGVPLKSLVEPCKPYETARLEQGQFEALDLAYIISVFRRGGEVMGEIAHSYDNLLKQAYIVSSLPVLKREDIEPEELIAPKQYSRTLALLTQEELDTRFDETVDLVHVKTQEREAKLIEIEGYCPEINPFTGKPYIKGSLIKLRLLQQQTHVNIEERLPKDVIETNWHLIGRIRDDYPDLMMGLEDAFSSTLLARDYYNATSAAIRGTEDILAQRIYGSIQAGRLLPKEKTMARLVELLDQRRERDRRVSEYRASRGTMNLPIKPSTGINNLRELRSLIGLAPEDLSPHALFRFVGLPDNTEEIWKRCTVGEDFKHFRRMNGQTEPDINVMRDEYIRDNIDKIIRLEEERPGICRTLYDNFKVINYARYPESLIILTYDCLTKGITDGDKTIMFSEAYDDWNGAGSKGAHDNPDLFVQMLIKNGFAPMLSEFETLSDLNHALEIFNQLSATRKSFGCIGGHGNLKGIYNGDERVFDIDSVTYLRDLISVCFGEGCLILHSCDVGGEYGFARSIYPLTGIHTWAPLGKSGKIRIIVDDSGIKRVAYEGTDAIYI